MVRVDRIGSPLFFILKYRDQANLLGSSIGLYIAYYLERYYRHRREVRCLCSYPPTELMCRCQIARLYRPLDVSSLSDDEDEDDILPGTQLLPTHRNGTNPVHTKREHKPVSLADVWDEREEEFGIGDSDEEDDALQPGSATPLPKIRVTHS